MSHPVAEFLKLLPDMDSPGVSLEEDGDLCFDWLTGLRENITASLSPEGKVSWAAIWADGHAHGSFMLADGFTPGFTSTLKRIAAGARPTPPQEK